MNGNEKWKILNEKWKIVPSVDCLLLTAYCLLLTASLRASVWNVANSALERIEVLDSHGHSDSYNYGGNAHNNSDLSERSHPAALYFRNFAVRQLNLLAGLVLRYRERVVVGLIDATLEFFAIAQLDLHPRFLIIEALSNFGFYFCRLDDAARLGLRLARSCQRHEDQ